MIKLDIKRTSEMEIINWCSKYISPREYWLHNRVGGEGWRLLKFKQARQLIIEDDKLGLMVILRFGDKL